MDIDTYQKIAMKLLEGKDTLNWAEENYLDKYNDDFWFYMKEAIGIDEACRIDRLIQDASMKKVIKQLISDYDHLWCVGKYAERWQVMRLELKELFP